MKKFITILKSCGTGEKIRTILGIVEFLVLITALLFRQSYLIGFIAVIIIAIDFFQMGVGDNYEIIRQHSAAKNNLTRLFNLLVSAGLILSLYYGCVWSNLPRLDIQQSPVNLILFALGNLMLPFIFGRILSKLFPSIKKVLGVDLVQKDFDLFTIKIEI